MAHTLWEKICFGDSLLDSNILRRERRPDNGIQPRQRNLRARGYTKERRLGTYKYTECSLNIYGMRHTAYGKHNPLTSAHVWIPRHHLAWCFRAPFSSYSCKVTTDSSLRPCI